MNPKSLNYFLALFLPVFEFGTIIAAYAKEYLNRLGAVVTQFYRQ